METPAPAAAAQITPEAANAALAQPVRIEADPNATQAVKPVEQAKGQPSDRPAWLPPKFKSAEDMAKAYENLEKKLGGKPAAEESKAAEEAKPVENLEIKAAEKAAEAKGIDLKAYEDEFAQSQTLSEKSYDALAKAGIPKEMVDTYIQGRQALMERSAEATLKSVGLDLDGYQKMGQWAAANVPKAELEAYNRIVTGNDVEAAKIALQGLQARYSKSVEPNFLRSGGERSAEGDVFRSTAELTKAMSDKRYANDPAYRHDVEQKLARSNIL